MTFKMLWTGLLLLASVAGVARAEEGVVVPEVRLQVEKVLAARFAPIILGGGNMVDTPASSRDAHERSTVRIIPCPPGITAVCIQRSYDRLAYLCLSGVRPKTESGHITKTTDGCEPDKLLIDSKKTKDQKKCRTYTEPSLTIMCDGPEDLVGLRTELPATPVQLLTAPSLPMPPTVPPTVGSPAPALVPTAASSASTTALPAVTAPRVPQALDSATHNPDAGAGGVPEGALPSPTPNAAAGIP